MDFEKPINSFEMKTRICHLVIYGAVFFWRFVITVAAVILLFIEQLFCLPIF